MSIDLSLGCPTHYRLYQFSEKSNLCYHPKCLEKLIQSFANQKGSRTKKYWKYIVHDPVLVDEAILDLFHYFKKYISNPDNLHTLNDAMVSFSLLSTRMKQIKRYKKEQELNKLSVIALSEIKEECWNHITPKPFSYVLSREILDFIAEEFGASWSLYFVGELSKVDILKIKKLSISQFEEKLLEVQVAVEDFLK